MKYPWMPLFWGDFLANTMHLSAQEAGAYLFLIAHAWEHDGEIPGDRVRLARIAHVRHDQWNRVWDVLENFFEPASGVTLEQCDTDRMATGFVHPRVMTELHRLGKISSNRKAAALQMHSKSSTSAEQMHKNTGASASASTSKTNKQSFLGEGGADAPSRAGAPNGARAPSPPPAAGRQGMSPDMGDDYRAPPAKKSDNQLRELPDRPASGSKWRPHTDDELKAIYAAKHEPNDDQ